MNTDHDDGMGQGGTSQDEANAAGSLRRSGAILTFIGLLAAWYGFWLPLGAVDAGANRVGTHFGAQVIAPVTLGLGLIWLVLGERAIPLIGHSLAMNRAGKILMWTLGALGVLGGLLFGMYLESRGYK